MKVSLIYCYADKNAGDFAITLGALDVLKECKIDVIAFSKDRKNSIEFNREKHILTQKYGRLELYECPFILNRNENIIKSIIHNLDGFLSIVGIRRNKRFRELLLDSDMVVFNGGNLFRCVNFADFARLCALMYPLKIALKAHKPYIIFPQSAAKINKVGFQLLSPIIKNAKMVFAREGESYQLLKKKFKLDSNIKQTIDLAFHINKSYTEKVENNERIIALTLRAHTVGDLNNLSGLWIEKIFKVINSIVNVFSKDYKFIIVVQTDKDDDVSNQYAQLKGIDIIKTNNVEELLCIYGHADLLIGMRLHSIILALSVGTPCFGLFKEEWGLKNPGLMDYFEMPYIFIDQEPNNRNMLVQISRLLNDSDKLREKIITKVDNEKNKFLDILTTIIGE